MGYRVWAAANAGADLVAQGDHRSLDQALAQAEALAIAAVVSIELPGRKWHTFEETGAQTLGPLEAHGSADGSERRQSRRFSTATIAGQGVSHLSDGTPVRLLDVSSEGAQLQLPARYHMTSGNNISIRIRGKRGEVDVAGRVAWVHRQRCGIEFDWDATPSFAKIYIRGLIADVEARASRRR